MAKWKENLRRKKQRKTFFKYGNYNKKMFFSNFGLKSASPNRRIARIAKFIFIFVILMALAAFVAVPIMSLTLPSPDKIVRRDGFSTKILDRNGQVLYDIFVDARRTPVQNINQIPEYMLSLIHI